MATRRRRQSAAATTARVVEPTEKAAKPSPRRVVGPLPLSLQLQRIGGSVTPAQVSNIIRQADQGYMYQLVDLANDARQKDGHLQSVLGTRENALCGLEWQCAAREKSTKRDKSAADFITDVLREATVPYDPDGEVCGFADLIAHLTGAAYHGYEVAETLLAKDGRYVVPAGWSLISPRRFVYAQTTGRLQWWDPTGSVAYPGVDLMATHPGKFITHRPRITGDVPCREGLARVLMWAALFRNWDLRDWMTLAELAWKPWRTGAYDKGASQEDIDTLVDILDGMSASGVAVYPNTTEVHVEWPKNPPSQGGTHKELADFLGAEMSKAVLGQTLTTEQGSRGSQALGRVHDEVRRDIRDADARSVAATIRRHLIAPLVRWNFGPDVAIPEFRFMTDDAVDLQSFAIGIKTLAADAKLRVPAGWVREQLGIPEPEDGEELLGDGDGDEEPDGDEPKPGDAKKPQDEPAADGEPKPAPTPEPND